MERKDNVEENCLCDGRKGRVEDNCQGNGWSCRAEDNCEHDRKDRQRITVWSGGAVCTLRIREVIPSSFEKKDHKNLTGMPAWRRN